MELEKFALPLTIVAAVIGIAAFIRGNKPAPAIGGLLPNGGTLPSFQSIPYISYNVATPTPPPIGPQSGNTFFVPSGGVMVNGGMGALSQLESDLPGGNCCSCVASGCGGAGLDGPDEVFGYFTQLSQSSTL